MSAQKLKFDVDKIRSMSTYVENLATELSNTSTNLTQNMEQLKADWNTPAGVKFFEEQTTTWVDEVAKYVGILTTMKEMLDYAATEYSALEDKSNQINIS